MSERLNVTGVGSTRVLALADADRQAAQFWDGAPTRAELGEARAVGRTVDGRVIAWECDVEFSLRDLP